MKLRGVELAAGMIITTVCKKHYVVLAEEDQNNSFVFADLGSGKYTGYLDENTITNIKDGNSNKTLWPKYREIIDKPFFINMFREKYIPKILASPDFDYSKLKDEELKGVIDTTPITNAY